MQTPMSGPPPIQPFTAKTGFLEESPGNRSSMRLMCMMSLVTAIILSGVVVGQSVSQAARQNGSTAYAYMARDPEVLYIIFGFLISAFAPKAVQKFAEQKLPAYDPTLNRPPATPYAGYLPPAAPISQQAPATPAPATPAAAAPAAPAAAPTAPASHLQNVLQRGAL